MKQKDKREDSSYGGSRVFDEIKKWIFPREDLTFCQNLIKEFHLHPVLAKLFIARGFQEKKEVYNFLYASLGDSLEDPFLFYQMGKAVERILHAKEHHEHIIIYGDSDVDGITGVTLLIQFFAAINISVSCIFLKSEQKQSDHNQELIQEIQRTKASLVITVDYGITAKKELQEVIKLGTHVIITDHHTPTGSPISEAIILNPKLEDKYPNRELTGVGVAFKLVQGIYETMVRKEMLRPHELDISVLLDLVALGTITDVGVLVHENRFMVKHGLKLIRDGSRLGLAQLLSSTTVYSSEISSTDLVLKIAPKINSVGRLQDPRKGVDLLLSKDLNHAKYLVNELNDINKERQRIESEVFHDVKELIENYPEIVERSAIVLASKNWHSRVIPIICSRLSKMYHKPVVMLSISDGIAKGSIRTVEDMPLLRILKKCSPLFLSYGGHDFAAGIVLKEAHVDTFKKKFSHLVLSSLKKQSDSSSIKIDAEVSFDMLDHELLSSLDLLEPFGRGNNSPTFYTIVKQTRYPKFLLGNHLKLYLSQNDRDLEGIAFGQGAKAVWLKENWSKSLQIVYTPKFSFKVGAAAIHLFVKDLKLIDN